MNILCSVEGCEKAVQSLGFCSAHYMRVRKYGDPLALRRTANGAPAAFLREANERRGPGCIIWPFARAGKKAAYGTVWHRGRMVGAHVAALEMDGRAAPGPGLEVRHLCGVSLCVNPDHLQWGTNADNHADKRAHGTMRRGSSHPHAKLTEKQVIDIRARLAAGEAISDVAASNGVHKETVRFIAHRATWAHV